MRLILCWIRRLWNVFFFSFDFCCCWFCFSLLCLLLFFFPSLCFLRRCDSVSFFLWLLSFLVLSSFGFRFFGLRVTYSGVTGCLLDTLSLLYFSLDFRLLPLLL